MWRWLWLSMALLSRQAVGEPHGGTQTGRDQDRETETETERALNRAALLTEATEAATAQYEEKLMAMAEQYRQDVEQLEAKLQVALAAKKRAELAAEQRLSSQLCGRCGCLLAAERVAEMKEAAAAAAAQVVANALRQTAEELAELTVNAHAWASEKWHESEPEPEPEPEPEFVPGLHFATRIVLLREFADAGGEDNPKIGQLEAGEVVFVLKCEVTEQHGVRLYCRSLVNTHKEGWASRALRRDQGAVLLQRIARPDNMPVLGQSYVAKQRIPVRDRAEVSSARIGWLEAGHVLHVTYVPAVLNESLYLVTYSLSSHSIQRPIGRSRYAWMTRMVAAQKCWRMMGSFPFGTSRMTHLRSSCWTLRWRHTQRQRQRLRL